MSIDRISSDCAKKKRSLLPFLLGFASFHVIFALVISVCLFFFIGSLCFARFIGLYLVLPYYTYTLFINRAELKISAAKRTWFSQHVPLIRHMIDYLSINLVASEELRMADEKENAQFVLAVFPHGTGAEYRALMAAMLENVLPNTANRTKTLAASVLFRLPLMRELCLWTRCVDARRFVADNLLRNGQSILVLPGGEAEQVRTVHGREIVYLKRRKGFIKLALKHNVPVVPVYAFGVSNYYRTSSAFLSARLYLVKKLGIAIPLSYGMWGSLICPRPIPTTIVFGKPLLFSLQTLGEPTTEELDAAHAAFLKALVELFEQYKHNLGYGERTLEIV